MSERKPFHESIVDALDASIERGMAPGYEIQTLARLITSTKIPKNHDAIIVAWQNLTKNIIDNYGFYALVVADLMEQKQEAEAKKAAKQEQQEAPHVSAKAEGD